MQHAITDDLEALLVTLPPAIHAAVNQLENRSELLEIVMDLGRLPEGRFPEGEVILSNQPVTEFDLEYVVERIGEFGDDNRAGIERTLHRISALRNRKGKVVGLTCRIGRAVLGSIALIRDIVEQGQSILILGRPGVGKTTLLREIARVLADEANKRVVVVDTSNEIAGDGDIPHPGIGRARRMQVARTAEQHAVMIEAVENHMPQVIVIDEIGTELEAAAARTIAERGVQLVATAHGNSLSNLLVNPTLSDLVGGIQTVTLGDEETGRVTARRITSGGMEVPTWGVEGFAMTPRTFERERGDNGWNGNAMRRVAGGNERARGRGQAPAPYQVHALAPTGTAPGDVRGQNGTEVVTLARAIPAEEGIYAPEGEIERLPIMKTLRVYPFGVSRDRLTEAARQLRVPIIVAKNQADADAVVTLKNYYRRQPERLQEAEQDQKLIIILKNNTIAQMQHALARIYNLPTERQPGEAEETDEDNDGTAKDDTTRALLETEDAIHQVLNKGLTTAELAPANAYIRRLQHQMATRYNLSSRSRGKEPFRRVKIFRTRD